MSNELWAMFQAFVEAITAENRFPDKLEWGQASKRASVRIDLRDEVGARAKVQLANRLLEEATRDARTADLGDRDEV